MKRKLITSLIGKILLSNILMFFLLSSCFYPPSPYFEIVGNDYSNKSVYEIQFIEDQDQMNQFVDQYPDICSYTNQYRYCYIMTDRYIINNSVENPPTRLIYSILEISNNHYCRVRSTFNKDFQDNKQIEYVLFSIRKSHNADKIANSYGHYDTEINIKDIHDYVIRNCFSGKNIHNK